MMLSVVAQHIYMGSSRVIQSPEMDAIFKQLIRDNAHLIIEFSQEERDSECRKYLEFGHIVFNF